VHFICSTLGSSGDVFPILGLALELRRRGHDITFATNEHFQRIVESYGLTFEMLGTEADYQACIRNPDLWNPRRAFRHVFQSLMPALKRQYEIHAAAQRSGAVVGITNCFGFGAFTAQDKLGMPVITVHVQPAVLWSDHAPPTLPGLFGPRWMKRWIYRAAERYILDPVVCPFLNDWRRELGLAPIHRITDRWHSPYGVLCMFPEWYATPQPDWPGNLLQSDFPLWNHQSDQSLAAEVKRFLNDGPAPLVFTPGSANVHGRKFFQAAVHACESLKRRGILLTGFPEQLPDKLPDSIVHFPFVPLDLLLPQSAAFIHHGGIGSMSQAMLAGIPQVLMPLAHDQFDNAARVLRLGIGESIPAPRFSESRLIPALNRLLSSARVSQACRDLSVRLNARDGLRQSATAIERRLGKD